MIDFDETAIVAVRRTGDGERFALFLNADVPPHWEQRFWSVALDTGGDGFGLPVRYGTVASAPSGWALRQLLCVAQARMELEQARAPGLGAGEVREAVAAAAAQLAPGEAACAGVGFEPGGVASPYPWTVARNGELHLPLCPDPASREEGVTPEQLLLVVDEALRDWAERAPYLRRLWLARNAVRAALAAETERLRAVRALSEAPEA